MKYLEILNSFLPSYFRMMEDKDPFFLMFLDNMWKSIVLVIEKCYWVIVKKIQFELSKYEAKHKIEQDLLKEKLSVYEKEIASLKKELEAKDQ